ncbi:MAG: quinolinate synthase NadA [Clostridia bacterium]|nr:MAG: quinolinate synthase NadA [Clostridia bacterium]
MDLVTRLEELKQERNAVILAHNYQIDEVQAHADFVGDSFELSRKAAATDAEVVVFCGVQFMAESAAILSPGKTVLLPEARAGCPLADTITPESLREKKAAYPQAKVVCYVNSSAAVKAESDVCCTSSNAVQVVEALDAEEILFVPDANLADYVAKRTRKKIIPWNGHCITHYRVTAEDVRKARAARPEAVVVVHPECRPEVVALADHVASTSGIIRFAGETTALEIIVGTEMGILYRLERECPDKKFFFLSPGLVCRNMKMTTLEKVVRVLETMSNVVRVPEDTRRQAYASLARMLEIA